MRSSNSFFCLFPCWAVSFSNDLDSSDLFSLPFDEANQNLCKTIHDALLRQDLEISTDLKIRLLKDKEEEEISNTPPVFDEELWQKEVLSSETTPILKGLPKPPFYCELAKRILLLTRWQNKQNDLQLTKHRKDSVSKEKLSRSKIDYRVLIDGNNLGLTENKSLQNLYYLPSLSSTKLTPSKLTKWLNAIGDDGIMEILGMRRTVGTKLNSLPPSINELQNASRKPHKPNSHTTLKKNAKNSDKPLLSVGARALSKHFHRGKTDQFFGQLKGNTNMKNESADRIISDMIRNAVWINIHTFGGVSSYILEIRLINGYGARWSADWEDKLPYNVTNVTFRGFLEPQMEDGFEKKWRH